VIDSTRRVLGVIRPSVEAVGALTQTGHIGVLGTSGTVSSQSYCIEIHKLFPKIQVFQQACPMWVPLVENNEYQSLGADFFIERDIKQLFAQSSQIDTLILACTHYPLLIEKIKKYVPQGVRILAQGEIVAQSLTNYLQRHPDMAQRCSQQGQRHFLTTDNVELFNQQAAVFLGTSVQAIKIHT
jgi:glutamate racemase